MVVVASPPCTKTATSPEESQSEVDEKYSEPKFSEPDFKVIYDGASNKPLTATEAESEHSVAQMKQMAVVASPPCTKTATSPEESQSEVDEKYSEPKFSEPDFKVIYVSDFLIVYCNCSNPVVTNGLSKIYQPYIKKLKKSPRKIHPPKNIHNNS
ncbi:uncharacterized protein LOC144743049 [Ciona intestinalis]